MNDLLGNHVPVAFGVLPPALGNLQAGTLRAIAVISPTRFSLLPDVPTASESGTARIRIRPALRTARAGRNAAADHRSPQQRRCARWCRPTQVKQRILAEGGDPLTSTPEEYAKDIDSEETKWATLIRKLNLKVE